MYTVIIAEDEPIHRRGLSAMVSRIRPEWVVLQATNGVQALELVRARRIDVLISDIRMPGMDGIELLENINRCDNPPLTVFVSGYDLFEYARKAVGLRAYDYLLKPVDEEKITALAERLEKELDMNGPREHSAQAKTGNPDVTEEAGNRQDLDVFESCRTFIEGHLGDSDMNLQVLAVRYFFSPSYFSSWFKNHMGENFNHYVTRIRMRKAAELLLEGHRVYEAAAAVGFGDVKYFVRVFRRTHHVTPGNYRKTRSKGE